MARIPTPWCAAPARPRSTRWSKKPCRPETISWNACPRASTLDSLDGRALLGDAARPLLARIPPGVHRQVLSERIARQIGVSPAMFDTPQGRLAEPVDVRSSPGATTRESLLARPLLGYLVRAPALFGALPASLASSFLDAPGEEDSTLFQRVARAVADDPGMEPAVLLARFARDPEHEALVALAPSRIDT